MVSFENLISFTVKYLCGSTNYAGVMWNPYILEVCCPIMQLEKWKKCCRNSSSNTLHYCVYVVLLCVVVVVWGCWFGAFFVLVCFEYLFQNNFWNVIFQQEKKRRKSWGLKLSQMKLDVQVFVCLSVSFILIACLPKLQRWEQKGE